MKSSIGTISFFGLLIFFLLIFYLLPTAAYQTDNRKQNRETERILRANTSTLVEIQSAVIDQTEMGTVAITATVPTTASLIAFTLLLSLNNVGSG